MASGITATVNFNPVAVAAKYEGKAKRAQMWLDNEILKDTSRFVRRQSGDLEHSGIAGTVIGSGLIVYNEVYSRKKYYDYTHVSKQANPQASREWFEVSKAIHKRTWISGVKRIGGG
jgi:hypothetical protein